MILLHIVVVLNIIYISTSSNLAGYPRSSKSNAGSYRFLYPLAVLGIFGWTQAEIPGRFSLQNFNMGHLKLPMFLVGGDHTYTAKHIGEFFSGFLRHHLFHWCLGWRHSSWVDVPGTKFSASVVVWAPKGLRLLART